jgi:ATP-dependent protease ClpP protease subunit
MLSIKRKHGLIGKSRKSDKSNKKAKIISRALDEIDGDEGEPDNENFNIMDLFNRNKEMIYRTDNHIYFRSDINTEAIDKLGNLLDEYNREYDLLVASCGGMANLTPKPIKLHITSDGGCLFSGLFGSDLIRNSKIPVHTIVEGSVASAGTLLSIAGKERYMTENSYLLIHQLSSGSYGNFEQLTDSHENNTELMKRLKDIYLKYTKLTIKQINESLKRDIYWNFEKSKKCGLIDDVYKL